MRDYRTIITIVVVFVVFIALYWYLSARRTAFDPIKDHSSLRTNRWGTKALRELLADSGLTVKTLKLPLTRLPDSPGVLFVLDPGREVRRRETDALLHWVGAGGWAVIAAEAEPGMMLDYRGGPGPSDILLAHLGLGLVSTQQNKSACNVGLTEEVALRDVVILHVPSAFRLARLPSKEAVGRHLEKIREQKRGEEEHIIPVPEITPVQPAQLLQLAGDEAGAVLVRLDYGQGRIYVLCDADMLGNGFIHQADNVVLAANLAFGRGASATILFDEYHHSGWLVRDDSVYRDKLEGAPIFAALWAIMLCLFLYIVGRMWRFGRPVPLPEPPRRSALEYVDAFAGLHRRAQVGGAAITAQARRLRKKLADISGLPVSSGPELLADAVARRCHRLDSRPLAALLGELSTIDEEQHLSDADTLRLSRQIAAIEEAIEDYATY